LRRETSTNRKCISLFLKGKTELVPMNMGIGDDLGLAKRATKRVLRLILILKEKFPHPSGLKNKNVQNCS
jgi:hypothetical protein